MVNKVITNEYFKNGKRIRKVHSFMCRGGRLTKSQQSAIKECWSVMGINYQNCFLDWNQVFGNYNPVILEIGFGMGKSLVAMAKNELEKNFFGIEVYAPGVGACLSSARDAGLTNLRIMHYDAIEVMSYMIPNNSLDRLQLFFPDPWHKRRHHKRRIIKSMFAETCRLKLKRGIGILHILTDWKNYAEYIIKIMDVIPGFLNLSENNNYIAHPSERPVTKFEVRSQRLGHKILEIKYKRIN
ncbi:tRNA (guanine-N(7)-)-methyltransferase [Candidatus Photodesmus katoptron]|uniref:tRNA (guanine-N(7)-)-methyltransferase n=1 Tax=Candidatus Photodesmus katoptron Akat1 TaxID=1236703 RepID=S3DZB3_9GAMM|nr:tRNA (guanosine(46)-N7)-methyltransferase TrmB [Candidatus Photodesmus katoptron]EPE37256.1 tRNA (guanine-N(7)-)-methyltransferase [Candidatus Photodesmus katoptron Akat1]KEY90087.1 tRNA (guanine-N(7)-)-methyltransferase [Candidatus Photodesmus katoptron]